MKSSHVQIDGLDKVIKALQNNCGLADEFHNLWDAIGLDLVPKAQALAPVSEGFLQNAIVYRKDDSAFPTFVTVGTVGKNKPGYAAWMEYGTGLLNDHPSWPKKRVKRPPAAAMLAWAGRKGRSRYDQGGTPEQVANRVSYFIWKNGGLKPRRFLRTPFEENEAKYRRWIIDTVKRVSFG